MTQPIRVPDEVYEEVKALASQRGITFQQAVQERLNADRNEIKQLDAERNKLAASLRDMEREVSSAKQQGRRKSEQLQEKQRALAVLSSQLSDLEDERTTLLDEVDALASRLADTEKARDQALDQAKAYKSKYNWSFGGLIGFGLLLLFEWLNSRQTHPKQAVRPQSKGYPFHRV